VRLANGRRREEKQTGRCGIAGEKEKTGQRRTKKTREMQARNKTGVKNDKREREGAEGERGGKSSSKGPPRGPEGLVRRRKPQ